MTNIASNETKKIPVERWAEWSATFTNGNHGRAIKIEHVNDEAGAELLADGAALVVLDYDPVGKGNNLVFSYGNEVAPFSHVIAGSVALWQAQDENGLAVSLQIVAEDGGRTIVTFN